MFAFIVLGILDTDHKKVVSIARIVLMLGMSVYLLYAHTGEVVHVFAIVGHKIGVVQQQSMDKGEKAARATKALHTLADQSQHESGNIGTEGKE